MTHPTIARALAAERVADLQCRAIRHRVKVAALDGRRPPQSRRREDPAVATCERVVATVRA